MNLTALVWLGLFVTLAGLTFRRSSWGIPLYMLTFYAFPIRWWWGQGLLTSMGIRWNLMAALIFAAGVFLDGRRKPLEANDPARRVFLLAVLYALNASVVHFLFADDPEHSWFGLQLLWKQVGLLFLMLAAIQDKFDLKLMIYSILIGSTYIGYEVVFNDEGSYIEGRLEGINFATTGGANTLPALFCLSIALGGYLLFCGKGPEKCLAVVSLVLILEVILRCVTRGVFLALIGAAVWLVLATKGRLRGYAIAGIVLAVVAALAQMGEEHQAGVLGRFATTFAAAETRDQSAQGRLDLWGQGIKMIRDHPLGSGYEATFKSNLGYSYIKEMRASKGRQRAVHNGYLDIAGSWGIQGLTLYLAALFLAWRGVRSSVSLAYSSGNQQAAFLGCCLGTALVTQLIAFIFMSTLKGEWLFWWIAMALAYRRALSTAATSTHDSRELDPQLDRLPKGESACGGALC